MPKHLEINNYTPTAPRTRQPSASLPITPLASTSSMTSSNTSANRCCDPTSKFKCRRVLFYFVI